MSEFDKISGLIQKFGLISGKKQIFKTIQSFLDGFEKADLAVCVTFDPAGRYIFDINSRICLDENTFIKLTETLEPFIIKHFSNYVESRLIEGISELIDFEYHSSPADYYSRASQIKTKSAGTFAGSLVIPVFIDSGVYSLFAIFSENEFELDRHELLTLNIVAHMSALALKTLSMNRKIQKAVNDLKSEKNALTERAAKLSEVLELSHSLISLNSYEKLLAVTINSYCRIFGIEQAVILGINHHKNELYIQQCAGYSEGYADTFKTPAGYGLIGAVIEKNEPYFRKNIFEPSPELAIIPFSGVSGIVCGAIALYDKFNKISCDDDEYELMWILANFFSLALNMIKVQSVNETFELETENIHNTTDTPHREEIKLSEQPDIPDVKNKTILELEDFKLIMRKFLTPTAVPETPGIEIAFNYLQSDDCGGDTISIFKTPGNYIHIALTDVSGRGAAAAITAAILGAKLKTICTTNGELRKIMFDLNNIVCEDCDSYNYITLFLLQISPGGGRAAFSSAGGMAVIHHIKDGSGSVIHESRNSPLGVMKNSDFKEGILLLNKGDILLLYTDGLSELKNSAGESLGRDRLCAMIKSGADLSAADLKDLITRQIIDYSAKKENYEDDIAFTVIKVG